MTATEVSTALRPFYFTVHPDLFGQFPSQRVSISPAQLYFLIVCYYRKQMRTL